MTVSFISYDGEYPNLCAGSLVLSVGGEAFVFPEYCLYSGGSVAIDERGDEHVDTGPWSIRDWPMGFPADARLDAKRIVNKNVRRGCCGGCV